MTNFEHRIIRFKAPTREAAESYLPVFNSIMEDLAKTNQVWVRTSPEVGKEVSFDRDESNWYARVRYSFKNEEPYGLHKVDRAYDNDRLVTSFGLSHNVTK